MFILITIILKKIYACINQNHLTWSTHKINPSDLVLSNLHCVSVWHFLNQDNNKRSLRCFLLSCYMVADEWKDMQQMVYCLTRRGQVDWVHQHGGLVGQVVGVSGMMEVHSKNNGLPKSIAKSDCPMPFCLQVTSAQPSILYQLPTTHAHDYQVLWDPVFEIPACPVVWDKKILSGQATCRKFFIISHYTICQSIIRASKFFRQISDTLSDVCKCMCIIMQETPPGSGYMPPCVMLGSPLFIPPDSCW